MNIQQTIPYPTGVTTSGAAMIITEPDTAIIQFSLGRISRRPREAFKAVHDAVQAIRSALAKANVHNVGVSRIGLQREYEGKSDKRKAIGFRASVRFTVNLEQQNLDHLADLLISLIDAGVHDIHNIVYGTSRLKELRHDARRMAIAHAREKAEVYCEAAGATLGPVLHIEDRSPMHLESHRPQFSQTARLEIEPDESLSVRAFDPGSMRVAGVVVVSFGLITEA